MDKDCKRCSGCRLVKPAPEFPINKARYDGLGPYCVDCSRARNKAHGRKKRIELLAFLGGECVRCGFSDWRALQIDHVNGDGAAERREGRTPAEVARRVRAHPQRYQILCANCNSIKRVEQGEHTGDRTYVRTIPTQRNVTPFRERPKMSRYSRARSEAADERQRALRELIAQRQDQRSPAALPYGSWSRWYAKCLGCQSCERKHASAGLCWKCNKIANALNRRPSAFAEITT